MDGQRFFSGTVHATSTHNKDQVIAFTQAGQSGKIAQQKSKYKFGSRGSNVEERTGKQQLVDV